MYRLVDGGNTAAHDDDEHEHDDETAWACFPAIRLTMRIHNLNVM